ncbi:MAG: HNH endonuclease signature motif containing protein [Pseudomonadota bacterium]
MAKDLVTIVAGVGDLKGLATLERRVREHDAGTSEIAAAIEARYAAFGRIMVARKTGFDLSDLSRAEEKIVNAVGSYVALQKRDGKGAERTFRLLYNRGLIEAAEVTVAKSKVTQGYEVLEAADLKALSFEQIIVDHPDEFSARALWYARKTLGLSNDSERPPADLGTLTQQRTERVLDWLTQKAVAKQGRLESHTNADVGAVLGFHDLTRHGRVLGNITSRIDFACYRQGVPPLGLCAITPFANAWSQEGRAWAFPVAMMQAAARTYDWHPDVLERIRREARSLPGQAAIPWRKEIGEKESLIRQWAEGLRPNVVALAEPVAPTGFGNELATLERNLLGRKPAVRERVSKIIERGTIGTALKRANGYRCQLCDALGLDAHSFVKANGEPYVEAHHATPVSAMEVGSLSAANIMILCANHHRQMHYGTVIIERTATEFVLTVDGHQQISIKRFGLDHNQ